MFLNQYCCSRHFQKGLPVASYSCRATACINMWHDGQTSCSSQNYLRFNPLFWEKVTSEAGKVYLHFLKSSDMWEDMTKFHTVNFHSSEPNWRYLLFSFTRAVPTFLDLRTNGVFLQHEKQVIVISVKYNNFWKSTEWLSAIDLFWQPFCGKILWNALGRTCLVSGVRSQCSPSPVTDITITEGLASRKLAVAVPAEILFFQSACLYCPASHRLAVACQAACSVRTVSSKLQWQCFIR